ncbi:MAG TPA: NAD(P)-dependent oxidoreductase [Acidimicrobiales bacterium]|nr:NAD(P)-dependent oxidoreductase [Acidimicrobiales bacterium]
MGFLGLGQMGSLLARRLVDWPGGLVVHDIRPEAAAALVDAGATPAASVADVAAAADLVCVMVLDDGQVRDVVAAALAAARPGLIVAVHSTIRVATAEAMAATCSEHGVFLLDAPVSGGAMGAAQGRLAVMVGGDRQAYERSRPAFSRFADLVTHFGPPGAGTRAKLARNLVNFVGMAASLEAQRLAEAAGVDLAKLARVTTHSDAVTGGPGAIMVRDTTAPLAPGDPLGPIFSHTRDLGRKDLGLALELAEELDIELPLARVAAARLDDYLGLNPKEER